MAATPSKILSMAVDESNTRQSEYRVLYGDQVKYLLVEPGTFDSEILTFPPDFLDQLPKFPPDLWTRGRLYRSSGTLAFDLSYTSLKGVQACWHPNVIDVLSLTFVERLSARVTVVEYGSQLAVAKIARFEFEMPRVEQESAMYQAIEGHGIGPAFLGHLAEHGRVMGLLIEKVEGERAELSDLEGCQHVVRRLHTWGIVHGDLNRHNFVVSPAGVTLIDFENAKPDGSAEEMEDEYERLSDQLLEETGRGGKALEWSDSN